MESKLCMCMLDKYAFILLSKKQSQMKIAKVKSTLELVKKDNGIYRRKKGGNYVTTLNKILFMHSFNKYTLCQVYFRWHKINKNQIKMTDFRELKFQQEKTENSILNNMEHQGVRNSMAKLEKDQGGIQKNYEIKYLDTVFLTK